MTMKTAVERLNAEYGWNLTDEEIDAIAMQAEAAQRLFQSLFEVDVEGTVPVLKVNPAEAK